MSVLIEFTKATAKRAKGERLLVDEGSAKSFVKKEVAKRISDAQLKAEAKKAAAGAIVDETDEDDDTSETDTDLDTDAGETTEQPAGGVS